MNSNQSIGKPRHFGSDNFAGICPEAWEALEKANRDHAVSYGNDFYTAKASDLIRDIFETDCEVFFTFNGTASNALCVSTFCNSYNALICHQWAHVATDECGAPEFFTGGSKVIGLEGRNGKLECDIVAGSTSHHRQLHFPKASALSLTQSTEVGTIYQPNEVEALCQVAREMNLKVHMDGARFANAVAALECHPREITWEVGIDVLCLGGTKNGLAVGEAVVFFDIEAAAEFDYRCKQAGQLASKMRLISAPWIGLLENDVWLNNARQANARARQLEGGLRAVADLTILFPTEASCVFVQFPEGLDTALRGKGWRFYDFPDVGATRLMCGWDTTEDDVNQFVADAIELAGKE